MRLAVGCVAVFALILTGCASPGGDTKETQETAQKALESHADKATKTVGDVVASKGMIELTGALGCGHCNFHTGTECAPALKTVAGDIYVMEGVEEGSELWDSSHEGGEVQVVGVVVEKDGVHHVTPSSFKIQ